MRGPAPDDRPVPWAAVGRIAAPAWLLLAACQWVRTRPALVERAFTHGLGRWAERGLGAVFGLIPWSVAEWIEVALIAGLLWVLGRGLAAVWRGRRSLSNAAAHGLARLVVGLGLVGVAFELSWGLNYGRAPLIDRMGLEPVDPDHPMAVTELVWLADDLVDLANDRYLAIHGQEDAGQMTAAPPPRALDEAVEIGWARAVAELGLHPDLAARRPPAKPLLLSPVMSRLGLSGFYFPFTAEPNVNTWTPGWQLPHTVAHEKAHQRGFASEDEANFIGFAVTIRSPDPTVQYSGLLFAQRRLLFALLRVDPDTAGALIARRLPGVQRDVTEMRRFWASQDGRARAMSSAINHAYLRANRVRGGIASYGLSTELILAWARHRALQFEPAPLEAPPRSR